MGGAGAVERMVWVIAGPKSARFGEIAGASAGEDNRGRAFGQKGVAVIGGEQFSSGRRRRARWRISG